MADFEQPYQRVVNQFNAAGDVNIGAARREIDATAAQAQLAALPLDRIPHPPGMLPPGSSLMPIGPNPLFVGREDHLRRLARAFAGGSSSDGQIAAPTLSPTVVITGLGGMGKTQLAAEFVHRYGPYFAGGVFWLSFDDPDAVPARIADCGGDGVMGLFPVAGDLRSTGQPSLDDRVRLVMLAWQSALPRLLVFDNCEDPALLARWRPKSGGCRVLATSRRAEWDAVLGVQPQRLDAFLRPQSVALLRRHRPDLAADDPDLDAIAGELGDLPLALHLAGHFLARYRHAIAPHTYLAELRRPDILQHASLQSGDISPTDHEQSVGRTFSLSYERLDAGNPVDLLARRLLARAAYCAPGEPIPRALLRASLEMADNDPQSSLQVEDALSRLTGLGLLEPETDGTLRLHRLLGIYLRGRASDQDAAPAVERALRAMSNQLNGAGDPRAMLGVQGHLRAVTARAKDRGDAMAASLCSELAHYLYQVGDYYGARPLLEQALAIWRKVLGDEHPTTAASLNNLAMLLRDQGDYDRARPLYEQALAIHRKVLGEEHADTAASFNNLAALLKDQGDYDGARPLFEQALTISRKLLGEEHPNTAVGLNNLAVLLKDQGDYDGARPLLEQGLAIRRKVLGEEHPDTATSLNNLALLLKDQGDYDGARPLFERALAICRKALGEEHLHTATSLNNLAMLLQAQGDYDGAKPLLEQALAIFRKVLGEEHPHTAIVRTNLARLKSAIVGRPR